MKRTLLSICMLLLAIIAASAQAASDKAIAEISAAASIKTMQCDFVQTKTLKMLGDKMVAKGEMMCAQPDRLRWEYLSPYSYTFILAGGKVRIIKGERSEEIDVNANKMFGEIARIMMDSVLGKCLGDKRTFTATATASGDNEYVATLVPQKKTLKQMFSKIVLHFDRRQAMVVEVELFERNGDFTQIKLVNIKKNQPLDESTF